MVRPPRLRPGDRVRFVSPASTPEPEAVERCARLLEGWGLRVEFSKYIFAKHAFLAGTDEQRLADFNEALREPGVKAIFATRGGKGAYRIADSLDFKAALRNPKLLVGFSEITILQLALYHRCRLSSLHGLMVSWPEEIRDSESVASFRSALMETDNVTLRTRATQAGAELTTCGHAEGIALGGNLDMMACSAGWCLPNLKGCILLLEDVGKQLGHLDRQLTMLRNSGVFEGIKGIALGQFTDCGNSQGWTFLDILRQRLSGLGVPILGGLPFGHGRAPMSLPIGTLAELDADNGTLTLKAAVS